MLRPWTPCPLSPGPGGLPVVFCVPRHPVRQARERAFGSERRLNGPWMWTVSSQPAVYSPAGPIRRRIIAPGYSHTSELLGRSTLMLTERAIRAESRRSPALHAEHWRSPRALLMPHQLGTSTCSGRRWAGRPWAHQGHGQPHSCKTPQRTSALHGRRSPQQVSSFPCHR